MAPRNRKHFLPLTVLFFFSCLIPYNKDSNKRHERKHHEKKTTKNEI